MTVPNFLIIGDIKAGSTSLYFYLKQHPNVYMPADLKELRYFSFDKDNPYHIRAKSTRVRTFKEYQSYFGKCVDEKAIGEASPSYLRSPIAAKKIVKKLPDVKLIVSLRNPADRLYSSYMMSSRTAPTKGFDEHCFSADAAWIKANYYWSDLKRYYDIFDKEKIKVILFDELKENTLETIADLFRFLNVDDTFVPNISVHNKGGIPRNQLYFKLLLTLKNNLKNYIRPSPRNKRIWTYLRSNSLTESKIDPHIRKKILEICEDDILRTQELVNRDLSSWLPKNIS